MGLERHLHAVELLDCHGRVSHTLTLLVDGSVRIDFADGRHATVDPATRRNLTPHVPVPAALMDRAANVTPW